VLEKKAAVDGGAHSPTKDRLSQIKKVRASLWA